MGSEDTAVEQTDYI